MTTYLDDPNHDWSLEPSERWPPSLEQMMEELADREWLGLEIILRGYAGLKQRHPQASDEDCLRTSMIWYFG